MEIGQKVIFNGSMKMLDKNTVGVIYSIHNNSCTIVYPQNASYEDDGNGGWKPIIGKKVQVYAHSAKLCDVTIVS